MPSKYLKISDKSKTRGHLISDALGEGSCCPCSRPPWWYDEEGGGADSLLWLSGGEAESHHISYLICK
jgi:hypothetical protein